MRKPLPLHLENPDDGYSIEELAPHGWEPGKYMSTCRVCREAAIGRKRFWRCCPCAVKALQAERAEHLAEANRLVEVIPMLRERLRDAASATAAEDFYLACDLAEGLLGWKPARIPPDARGENECVVLTATGSLPEHWQPAGLGFYARHAFIPRSWGNRNHVAWFASIEEALAFARTLLRLKHLRWSRDIGGTFILSSVDIFDPRSGRSSSHCPTDAYAIIHAALGWIYHGADNLIVGRRK